MSARLVRRLKRAFHLNHIPVDPATEARLELLNDACLLQNAKHWEQRAEEVRLEKQAFTIRECKSLLERIQGKPPNGSVRGQAVFSADHQYHGSSSE